MAITRIAPDRTYDNAALPVPKRNSLGQIASSHVDLPVGAVFDRLTVVGDERREGKQYTVLCRCDCGRVIRTRVDGLRIGKKKQCGDHRRVITEAQRESLGARNRTHGASRSVEYNSWIGMKMRCSNPKDGRYEEYGGRGISVFPEWESSFEAFLAYMGLRPTSAHSLDRIDNDGNYEPGNVRWATRSTQVRNRRPFVINPGSGKNLPPLPPPPDYIPPPPAPTSAHRNTKHGKKNTPEYQAWASMKKRCLDPNHPAFEKYGGRGITIHPEWIDDFMSFLSEVGMRPKGRYSLDRIDNDRGYVPGNVRWADAMTQNRNRRAFLITPRA